MILLRHAFDISAAQKEGTMEAAPSRNPVRGSVLLAGLVVLAALAPAARAAPLLLGNDFDGMLYDIDAATGATTHPRPTGLSFLFGVALAPDGAAYSVGLRTSDFHAILYRIDPATGTAVTLGDLGFSAGEGDLAFQPGTGALVALVGVQNAEQQFPRLYRLDTTTAAATQLSIINTVGPVDGSAMAFRPDGTLFVVDTGRAETGDAERLLTVDPTTGAVLASVPLPELGSVAGAVFDPGSGRLLVADGDVNATDRFYSIDPATGLATNVGPTVPDGLAGLSAVSVPEPASAGAWLALASLLARRRRRA
jgi:outer membrane protein assembly factor BamB